MVVDLLNFYIIIRFTSLIKFMRKTDFWSLEFNILITSSYSFRFKYEIYSL